MMERKRAKFGAANIYTPLLMGLDTAIPGTSQPYHPKPGASFYVWFPQHDQTPGLSL